MPYGVIPQGRGLAALPTTTSLKRCAEVLNNPRPRRRFVNSPSTVRRAYIAFPGPGEIMLRFVLFIAPLVALAACASGPQGIANRPAPECRPWPRWQQFTGLPNLKYRLRLCNYDEASLEQIWDVQLRNDYNYGVSFRYALGEEPVRDRTNLASGRTSSSHRLRTGVATPRQRVWLHVERFCSWPSGRRSC